MAIKVWHQVYEKGKSPQTLEYLVPPEMEWMYVMLEKQNKLLEQASSRIGWLLAIVILGSIAILIL